jgi:hypothetical protein
MRITGFFELIALHTIRQRALQVAAFGAFVLLSVACSSEQAVPQSERAVQIIEYPAADESERSANHISLIKELALTDDLTRPFHTPQWVAVDRDGGIYVGDISESIIHAFDASGLYRTTIGRPGPGPGEIDFLRSIAIVGDNLVAVTALAQITIWDLDGNLREIITKPRSVRGLPQVVEEGERDSIVMVTGESSRWEASFWLHEMSLTGEIIASYGDSLTVPSTVGKPPLPDRDTPLWAVSPTGAVYTAVPDEYEVSAYAADGTPTWVLTTDYAAPALDDADVSRAMEMARWGRRSAKRGDYSWPERFKPLRHLNVDGHGHLFVYLFTRDAAYAEGWRVGGSKWMVDVYSRDGERLFTGTIDGPFWMAAQGDYVYSIEEDPETAEYAVTRRRIEEPF